MATTTGEDMDDVHNSDDESGDEMEQDRTADIADDRETENDSDSEDETANPRIEELESQLRDNPYLYDSHIELITAQRADGHLEKLREARQNMHKYYPLTEQLWLDWLNDEAKLLSPQCSGEDIYKLFETATEDYLSVPIWLEYVQFSIREMGTVTGMRKCRDIFEKALIAVGVHTSKGSHVWDAYRELEGAILDGSREILDGGKRADAEDEAITAQLNRVTTLYKRQLSVPLLRMDQTWNEYKEWADDNGKSLEPIYKQTLQKLQQIKSFEKELQSESLPLIRVYNDYLDYELQKGEPTRIQCLFERAVKDHCLQPELWIKYLTYLDENLGSNSRTLGVYGRAIRNCAWSVDIWLRYLRAMERGGKPHDDIVSLFEQALSAGFTESYQFLLLWTGYCDYLRRRIDWKSDHEKTLEIFRTSMERGMQHLYQLFGNDGDPQCTLHQYWASVEARYCDNMTKCREIWSEIMTRGHGNEAKMWLEYLTIERNHGDSKHCRKLLQRAVNSVTDWPEAVCEAYVNFEREDGTLSDYDLAVQKTKAQLKRVEQRRQQQAEKEDVQKKHKKGQKKVQPKSLKFDQTPAKEENQFEKKKKRKQEILDNTEAPAAKSAKTDPLLVEKAGEENVFKVPVAPVSESKPKKIDIPPGYVPVTEDKTTKPDEKHEAEHGQTEKDHFDPDCTVFVSNLAYDVTEIRLRETFRKCGGIGAVKLATVRGQSRGFAYVEFTSSVCVAAALSLDRESLESRPMFVSPYKQKNQSSQFKYGTIIERSKLFVSGLPPTCTKEALETIFKVYGEIKAIRIVTNRSGVPKGLAYVEFVEEQAAASAILKTDGLLIGDQQIAVAISNPPARKPKAEEGAFTPTLGGGKKDTGRTKAHTMIAFTPRSIRKSDAGPVKSTTAMETTATTSDNASSGSEKTSGSGSSSGSSTQMKSNADFRNLLLKK